MGVLLAGVEVWVGHGVKHRIWRKFEEAELFVGDEFRHELRVELRPAAFPARVYDEPPVACLVRAPAAVLYQEPRRPGGVRRGNGHHCDEVPPIGVLEEEHAPAA